MIEDRPVQTEILSTKESWNDVNEENEEISISILSLDKISCFENLKCVPEIEMMHLGEDEELYGSMRDKVVLQTLSSNGQKLELYPQLSASRLTKMPAKQKTGILNTRYNLNKTYSHSIDKKAKNTRSKQEIFHDISIQKAKMKKGFELGKFYKNMQAKNSQKSIKSAGTYLSRSQIPIVKMRPNFSNISPINSRPIHFYANEANRSFDQGSYNRRLNTQRNYSDQKMYTEMSGNNEFDSFLITNMADPGKVNLDYIKKIKIMLKSLSMYDVEALENNTKEDLAEIRTIIQNFNIK